MQNDWAYAEFRTTPLWDARCRATLIGATQQLAQTGEMSLSRALGSRRKAVSRIVHHPETSAADLLAGHVGATSLRCQAHALVLIASDTTICDFTTHKALAGLGPICDKDYQRGFFVHCALALAPSGVPLGLLAQHTWVRDASEDTDHTDHATRAKQRRQRDFADEESHKWLDALRAVEAALPARQKALLMQDREADIFDFFAAPGAQEWSYSFAPRSHAVLRWTRLTPRAPSWKRRRRLRWWRAKPCRFTPVLTAKRVRPS